MCICARMDALGGDAYFYVQMGFSCEDIVCLFIRLCPLSGLAWKLLGFGIVAYLKHVTILCHWARHCELQGVFQAHVNHHVISMCFYTRDKPDVAAVKSAFLKAGILNYTRFRSVRCFVTSQNPGASAAY